MSVYCAHRADSRGRLLFFPGSGYGAEPALRRLMPAARSVGLDGVVLNYFLEGEPRPSVSDTMAAAQAAYEAIAALKAPAARTVYVVGHSLDAQFAQAVAVHPPVTGVILAGPSTTPAELANAQLPRVIRFFVTAPPNADLMQLDCVAQARRLGVKTLVFTSKADPEVPVSFAQRVYGRHTRECAEAERRVRRRRAQRLFQGAGVLARRGRLLRPRMEGVGATGTPARVSRVIVRGGNCICEES